MEKLDVTEAEARTILADDAKIDKGEKLFELSKEQKQAEKSMRAAGRIPTVYKFTKRERKADPDKGKLIGDLLDGIPYTENVQIINNEREFVFTYKDRKYKVVLSCPRN